MLQLTLLSSVTLLPSPPLGSPHPSRISHIFHPSSSPLAACRHWLWAFLLLQSLVDTVPERLSVFEMPSGNIRAFINLSRKAEVGLLNALSHHASPTLFTHGDLVPAGSFSSLSLGCAAPWGPLLPLVPLGG